MTEIERNRNITRRVKVQAELHSTEKTVESLNSKLRAAEERERVLSEANQQLVLREEAAKKNVAEVHPTVFYSRLLPRLSNFFILSPYCLFFSMQNFECFIEN